jgi:hypothetical protein
MNDTEFVKARLLQIECEMQGMIAENQQRELLGQSVAYSADAFQGLSDRVQELINKK